MLVNEVSVPLGEDTEIRIKFTQMYILRILPCMMRMEITAFLKYFAVCVSACQAIQEADTIINFVLYTRTKG